MRPRQPDLLLLLQGKQNGVAAAGNRNKKASSPRPSRLMSVPPARGAGAVAAGWCNFGAAILNGVFLAMAAVVTGMRLRERGRSLRDIYTRRRRRRRRGF